MLIFSVRYSLFFLIFSVDQACIVPLLQNMKTFLLFITILLTACAGRQQDYRKAENALDAGREYIQSCLQGDFSKAAFYMLPDKKNALLLKEAEKAYREKDKEGRQQFRLASININEVTEINQTTTLIKYSNSFDKLPQTIGVVKQNGSWLVDPANTQNPGN